jgi:predicted dehydrogenase
MSAQEHSGTNEKPRTTRRHFLRGAGVAAAAVTLGSRTRAFAAAPTGANSRLGIGMIGCGGRGTYLMGQLQRLREEGAAIELVAGCDVYRPRMERFAERFGVKGYMDHRELLADPDIDVVGIATPDHIHAPQVIDAVRAGKHVYCEKPFTHWRQFELTKEATAEVKRSGCVFQLGTQGMSDSAWHQARRLVEDGVIGQPIHAECGYFRVGDWGERGMPIDDPEAQPGPNLNWEAFLGDAPQRPFDVSRFFRWRMYEDYSGGPSTDLFPHSLTPVIYMLALGMPDLAVATGGKFRYDEREVPDTFNMLADYPGKITLAVLGTQGNDYQGASARGSGGRCPTLRGWEGTLTFEKDLIVFTRAEGATRQMEPIPIERPESVMRHWEDLLACCRNGGTPSSPIDLAFHVQTALQMAVLSLRHGKTARYGHELDRIEI